VQCDNTGRQARLRLNATFDDKREMTKPPYDAFTVLDTAMQIIEDEHHHFVNRRVDNQDHIPRIVRIAKSAGKILKSSGMPKQEVESNVQRIIRHGRQLFVEEWMLTLPHGENQDENEAIEAFERYVTISSKSKRRKSSNQAL
jgi:hypothetical protein